MELLNLAEKLKKEIEQTEQALLDNTYLTNYERAYMHGSHDLAINMLNELKVAHDYKYYENGDDD